MSNAKIEQRKADLLEAAKLYSRTVGLVGGFVIRTESGLYFASETELQLTSDILKAHRWNEVHGIAAARTRNAELVRFENMVWLERNSL